jgi:hypothetical protein
MPFVQRRQNAERGVESGHRIGDRRSHDARIRRIDEQAQKSAGGLRHGVERRAVAVGAFRAEARDRGIDKTRVDSAQPIRIDAELRRHAGTEILDEDVGISHKGVEDRQVVGVARVERDAVLVAVIGLIVRAVETAFERAKGVASDRLFDLDDLCTEVRQQHSGGRTGDESAHFEHGYVGQRLCHSVSPGAT